MSVSKISSSVPGLSGVGFGTSISCAAPTLLAAGDLVTITIRYQTNITVNVLGVSDNLGNPATFYGTCENAAATGATKAFDIYYIVANGSETTYSVSYDVSTFNSIEAAGWRSSKGGTPTIVNTFANRENALGGPYLWDAPVDEISNGDCVLMFFFGNNETRTFTAPTGGSADPIAIMYEEEIANNRELWFQTQSSQQFIPGYSTTTGGSAIYTTSSLMILRDTDPTPPPFVASLDPSKAGSKSYLVELPSAKTGYQLDAPWSFWSVIQPQASTNLMSNPSLEYAGISSNLLVSGWNTITTSVEGSPRGFYHARISGPSGSAAYVGQPFQSVNAGYYSFSIDIYHTAGQDFSLEFRDVGPTITYGIKNFVAQYTGWGRYSLTTPLLASTAYTAIVSSSESGNPIRVDGWLVEESKESTTYFDGDFSDNSYRAENMYNWKGFPGFAFSTRSNKTRSGGKIVSWAEDAMFRTTVIQGLDLPDADVDFSILSSGNEIMTSRNPIGRDVRILGRIYGCSKSEMQKRASEFIRLLKPQTDNSTQRTIVRFMPVLDTGQQSGKPLYMYVTNVSGVTGNYTNWFQEEFGVDLRLSDPRLYEEFGTSTEIPFNALGANDTLIGDRSGITGIWNDYSPYGSTTGGEVNTIEYIDNEKIYVGGNFTQVAGAAAARIAYFNGVSWVEADNGLNADVHSIKTPNLEQIYLVGDFTADGSGAGTIRRFAMYFASLDSIFEIDGGLDASGLGIVTHNSGLFIAGTFTQNATGTRTNLNYACQYNYSTSQLTDLDQGLSGFARTVVIGPDNNPYFGGDFTLAGSGALSVNRVTMWNTVTGAWEALGQGMSNGIVYALAFDRNGILYAGGSFTLDGNGDTLRSLAKWNGFTWEEVFSDGLTSNVRSMIFDRNNHLYVSCDTDIAGGSVPSYISGKVAKVVNGVWVNADFFSADWVRDFDLANDGRLGIALNTNGWGSSGSIADGTTIDYDGTADAPVKILINGPGEVVEIVNWTTGAKISCKGLVLSSGTGDGERLVIDLTGDLPRISTSLRKDVSKFFLNGLSDFNDFRLVPGENHITCSIRETTDTTTKCVISWRNTHWSISEAYV